MHAGQTGPRAENRGDDVQQVAGVVHNRHGDVAVGVGLSRGVEQFLVAAVEFALGGVLMVEHLDDLLPVDRFFDEAVHIAEHTLLAHELGA